MRTEKMLKDIDDLVNKNLPDFDTNLFEVEEKLVFNQTNFYQPEKWIMWVYECVDDERSVYLNINTLIDGDDLSIVEMSCEYIDESFILQKSKNLKWDEVKTFLLYYLNDREFLMSQNIPTPIVYQCIEEINEGDRYERNQILLWSLFDGLCCDEEEFPELFKVYETYEDYSHRVKSLPSKGEPSFIDESDMMVSFLKEQIRNGTFEEWVGKQ